MKKKSIKRKALLLYIILPISLVMIFNGAVFYLQFNTNYQNAQEQLLSDSKSIRDSVYIDISRSFEILRNLAVNPMVRRVADRMNYLPKALDNDDFIYLDEADRTVDLMNRVAVGTNVEFVYMASIKSSGILIGENIQIVEGFDVRSRDYYQGALQNPEEIFISHPRISAEETLEPKIVITAAKAILDDNGRNAGVVAFNYNFDPIIAIFRKLMEEYSVHISLIDTTGMFLLWSEVQGGTYFYDPENIVSLDNLIRNLEHNIADSEDIVKRIIGYNQTVFSGINYRGNELFQSIKIPDTRWAILVSSPIAEINAAVSRLVLPPIIGFLIAFIILQVGMLILTLKGIINPLISIGDNLKDLSESDADLTVEIPSFTNDEIGEVAKSFNKFVFKLRTMMMEVKTAITGTGTIEESVASSTENTSTAIEEISANLESINRQIEILDTNINDTVTAIEEVTRNIASVDDQIVSQSAMVEQSTASITQMISSMESVNLVAQNKRSTTQALSQYAGDGKYKMEETARTFQSVVNQFEEIQDMANTINAIAAQTNLLSMNAAIEAAHAGESGRGFAVVAEEIRKLADSAGTSSKAITQIIKEITSSVTETDKNVAETSEAFDKISQEVQDTVNAFSEIEQSVAELNLGGRQILESTNQINEVTISIRNGSKEIKSGTSVMLTTSSKIKEASHQVTIGMAESTSGIQEIVRSIGFTVKQTQELKDIVNKLKKDFGQFKTD